MHLPGGGFGVKNATPEHNLQIKINQWCRENVPQPHFFFGVDRAKKSGQFTHVREKSRGLVAGTPDTMLLMPGLPAIAVELKAFGKKVEEGGTQEKVGIVVMAAGHLWGWCDTVVGYRALLLGFGVLVSPYSLVRAEHHDAVLAGAAIKREEAKTGVPSKKRFAGRVQKPKPAAARLKAMEALRARVQF